jgi:hypothetical protein
MKSESVCSSIVTRPIAVLGQSDILHEAIYIWTA